ncbi:MAG: hypothetical protein WBR33_17735, partial [Pseudonocardiaceae bacterium]
RSGWRRSATPDRESLRELALRKPQGPCGVPTDLAVRGAASLDHTADPNIDRLLPADFTTPPPEAMCLWWDSDSRIS